ncbi:MAG: 50S ribosomal protein L13 [Desulfovermiculus sp.]
MNTFKTYSVRKEDVNREWIVVDAANQVLGRLSSVIATKLRGKDRPDFTPHVDNGAFVVVINADKIRVTGTKLDDKKYYRHSGYPGGLKETSLKDLLKKKPEEAIHKAVRGMLPKTRLGRAQLKKLKVYAGQEHPHKAQQPTALELS